LNESIDNKKHKICISNARPHEAQLEDQKPIKSSKISSRKRKSCKTNKRHKNSKPSQNDKYELRKAQKHKDSPLNQLPLTLSMQALLLR
jgi:hypothetical protein